MGKSFQKVSQANLPRKRAMVRRPCLSRLSHTPNVEPNAPKIKLLIPDNIGTTAKMYAHKVDSLSLRETNKLIAVVRNDIKTSLGTLDSIEKEIEKSVQVEMSSPKCKKTIFKSNGDRRFYEISPKSQMSMGDDSSPANLSIALDSLKNRRKTYEILLRNLQNVQNANYALQISADDLLNYTDGNESEKNNSSVKSEFRLQQLCSLQLFNSIERYLEDKVDKNGEGALWRDIFLCGSIGIKSSMQNHEAKQVGGNRNRKFPLLISEQVNQLNRPLYTGLKNKYEDCLEIEIKDSQSPLDATPYIENLFVKSFKLHDLAEMLMRKKESNCEDGFLENSKRIENTAAEYVNSFIKLSSAVVFAPQSATLDSMKFRSDSGFLDELICPTETHCVMPRTAASSMHKYYRFTVGNPFVCATAMRVVQKTVAYKKEKNQGNQEKINNSEEIILSSLRDSIFKRCVEREFRRYLMINRKTYRLSFNRMMDSLVACPYNQVSSIENIKPIRLAEKIKIAIHNMLVLSEEPIKNIKIAVVGHTDPSFVQNTGENNTKISCAEAEFEDLGRAVKDWMEMDQIYGLNIEIDNVYNMNDIARVFLEPSPVKKIPCCNKKSSITLKYSPTNYDKFAYGTKAFKKEILDKSDIVFLLDCPFLTDENYEISTNNSLENYCRSIQSGFDFVESNIPMDSRQKTSMHQLNSQYNRIMASNTREAGNICRVFQDYWVDCIRKSLKESKSPKVVYVFSSETNGLAYSTLSMIPTSRIEKYGGKTFNIFRFSSYKGKRLPAIHDNHFDKFELRIELWRMLKYISVEGAIRVQEYLGIPKYVLRKPQNLLQLYIATEIVIRERTAYREKHYYDLDVSVQINEDHLPSVARNIDRESFIAYQKAVLDFIKNIYRSVYFPSPSDGRSKFGDELLREAFVMNLYSAARDVRGMWFLHQYEKACEEMKNDSNNAFSQFHISVSDEIKWCKLKDQEEGIKDLFMDKKLYRQTMKRMESTDGLGFNLLALVLGADEFYEDTEWGCGPEVVLNNLLKVCVDAKEERSQFYENCRMTLGNL